MMGRESPSRPLVVWREGPPFAVRRASPPRILVRLSMPDEPARSGEVIAEPPTLGTSGFHVAGPTPPVRQHVEPRPTGRRLAFLSLAALGVVYGDIGTSPLYALRECFRPEYHIAPVRSNVYGVLSLIVWALILIVSIKYIVFIMRADNRGEGGILALLALLLQGDERSPRRRSRRYSLVVLGLFGAALLYGDGMITPAISVLGAIEGLLVAAPQLHQYTVVGATVAILLLLFGFQRPGTPRVGGLFGPVMLLWFATIAGLGLAELVGETTILMALDPRWGVQFFVMH